MMATLADALTPEEETALAGFLAADNTPPPPDEGQAAPQPPATDPAAAPPAPAAPAAEPDAPPAPAAPAAPEQTDDERFAAFAAKHAGKSPEEIAKLAFQQSQRANGAEARERESRQTLQQINDRVRAATERAATERQRIADERKAFDQRLKDDPDAALAETRDRQDAARQAQIDAEEFGARAEAAVGYAATAMPGYFPQNHQTVRTTGIELGYTPEEIAGISDGRDLVTLSLASMAASLMRAGRLSPTGELLPEVKAVAETVTDPRLTGPTPPATLSSAPARSTGGAPTPVSRANDILSLSDDAFAKLPPAELEALMRQLEGAG